METEKSGNPTYLNSKFTFHKNDEVGSGQPVQINIYQSNNYRKGLYWLNFNNKPWVEERHQLKDQQSHTQVSIAYPIYLSSAC